MARERMVTRTIVGTVAEVKAYNNLNDEMVTIEVIISGEKLDEKESLVAVKRLYKNNLEYTPLKVLSIRYTEQLYGMKEVDFMKYAVPIEPGATKIPEKTDSK